MRNTIAKLANGTEALALRDACLFIKASILQNSIVEGDNASLISISVLELGLPWEVAAVLLDYVFLYLIWACLCNEHLEKIMRLHIGFIRDGKGSYARMSGFADP